MGVLDGSEVGLRYPHYLPSVQGPDYESPTPEWPDMISPLRMNDFLLLQPGEAFDPTEPVNGAGYLPLIGLRDFVPPAAGRYLLSLTLSTESLRNGEWLGRAPRAEQDEVMRQVGKVPRCKVTSNVLTIDVY